MALIRFHLSIPAIDLDDTERWYVEGLGCGRGRRSPAALILELGGHQLVAQRVDPRDLPSPQGGIYPRHFGLILDDLDQWRSLGERARRGGLRFGVQPKCRFPQDELEHHTFFLIDPAANWLEFKCYSHPEAVLGHGHRLEVGDADFR